MTAVLQCLVNGLSIGGLYALVAIGYSLIFGILNFVNFAHGDFYMLGAYLVMSLGIMTLPLWLALPVGLGACAALSVWVYQIVYRPMAKRDRLTLLIAAVAISLLLENGVQLWFGGEAQAFPFALPDDMIIETFGDGDLVIRVMDLWIFAIAMLLALGTWAAVRFTKLGLGIRAIASNRAAAVCVGVPVDRAIAVTFFVGAALATVAGTLQSMATNQITPLMGVAAGLKAFVAAVLGGIGSIWGAVLGGLVLGLLDSLLISLGASMWKDVVVFALLIALLLVRPQGFLGREKLVKV